MEKFHGDQILEKIDRAENQNLQKSVTPGIENNTRGQKGFS